MPKVKSAFKKVMEGIACACPLVSVPILNLICLLTGSYVTFIHSPAWDSYFSVMLSFFCVIFIIGEFVFAVRRRDTTTLVLLGVWNLLLTLLFVFDLYPQVALTVIFKSFAAFVDRFTLIDPSQWIYNYDEVIAAMAFTGALGVASVVLSITSRKAKEPKPLSKKGAIKIAAVCVCAYAFFLGITAVAAELDRYSYFSSFIYSAPDVSITDKTDKLFDEVKLNENYSVTQKLLKSNGYVTISEYEEGLSPLELKWHSRDVHFIEDRGYDKSEIFFKPSLTREYIEENGFEFIFVKTDENGAVISKGRGFPEKVEDILGNTDVETQDDIVQCFRDFHSDMKIGEKKESVLKRYEKKLGGRLLYQTDEMKNDVQKERCLFGLSGWVKIEEMPFEISFSDLDVFDDNSALIEPIVELCFENGRLSDATLYYEEYADDESHEKIMRVMKLKES